MSAFSLGDFFPLKGSRRAASIAAGTTPRGGRRSRRPEGGPGRRHRRFAFEAVEQRLLLNADLLPAAAYGLADGIDLLGTRVTEFLLTDDLLGDRVPILLKAGKDADGDPVFESPTLLDLLSVPVDANGDGDIGEVGWIDPDDSEELLLAGLDRDAEGEPGHGVVDPEEFLQAWFFDPVRDFLDEDWASDTLSLVAFLTDSHLGQPWFLDRFDRTLDLLGGDYEISFEVVDAKVADTTQNPDAEYTFSVGFKLTITQTMPIDLGLTADALKLLPFTGTADNSKTPKVPVEATLDFAFDFGIHTGGLTTDGVIDAEDFFIRRAEPVTASVKAEEAADPNFHLNVGFLGTEVQGYDLTLQADVLTDLLDPDDPEALGFTDAQHGLEWTGGVVMAANALAPVPADHSAGFFLRIGNIGVNTPVMVVDADPDTAATPAEVIADIEAALALAGLDGVVSVELDSGHVKFSLPSSSETPLGFLNETYPPLSVVTNQIAALPDGDGPNSYEYLTDQTFLLSVGGAIPVLVSARFQDPAKTDIGFGDQQTAAPPRLVAQYLADTFGQVGADASFGVRVTYAAGGAVTKTVTVLKADTDGTNPPANTSPDDLAADVAASLALPEVTVSVVDGRIVLTGNATVSAIEITTADTVAEQYIGFAADQFAGLTLTAAGEVVDPTFDDGNAATNDDAHIEVTVNGVQKTVVVAPGSADGSALATAIDAALAAQGLAIDAVYVAASNKIVLRAQDDSVHSFSIRTINADIDDLVDDVNRALAYAGVTDVTASQVGGTVLVLTASASQSIEISRTLTFDAGVTYAELNLATPTEQLFAPSEGGDSKVQMVLPVHVIAGLYDEVGAVANWNPANVAIITNFDPFDSPAAEFDGEVNRFDILFEVNPEDQDDPSIPIPSLVGLDPPAQLVNFAELLNFNIVGAESMIGLLGSLGTALQQLARTPQFTGYDIPFADATLSDLLNFTDSDKKRYSGLIDMLMYDTGGDGVDPGPTVANDHDGLLKWGYKNSTSYLLPAFSTAQSLATRLDQLLDGPLSGAGGINATYDTESNELTYRIDLRASDRTMVTKTIDSADVSFEHDVSLAPFSKLTIDSSVPAKETSVELKGRTGLDLTFGVDLSPPGFVIFHSTELDTLNGGAGVAIRDARAVTGETAVRSVYGITRDSTIRIAVDFGPSHEITIHADGSADNLSIWDLVQDIRDEIDAVLDGTPDEGKVLVGVDGSHPLRLAIKHDGTGSLQVFVDSSDPWVTELGFLNNLSGGVPIPDNVFYARKDAQLLVGRLSTATTEAAELMIEVLDDGSGHAIAPIKVSIQPSATAGNRTIADLVADVDNALAVAGLDHVIKAGFDGTRVGGQRLVLYGAVPESAPADPRLIEFTVYAATAKAKNDLGIPFLKVTANQDDFVIVDKTGAMHAITLDPVLALPSPTVGDVIDLINAAFPDPDGVGPLEPLVTASLNGTHTGLRLVTTTTGTEQFRVETINGSGALLGLGLFLTGDDALPDTFGDGDPQRIEGGGIGLTHLDQRFFVRDAQIRIDGLQVKTPDDGVPGEGLYGIVGLDTVLGGSLMANVTAQLLDPANDDSAMNQITLTELLDKKTGGTLADPVVSKVVELAYDGQITLPGWIEFAAGGRLVTITPGDSAVIVGVIGDTGGGDLDGKLLLAHVTGSFENDEVIGQFFGPQETAPYATAYANGTTAAAGSFGDFSFGVTVQPGFDDDAFDADFAALSSYTLPFQLVTFGAPDFDGPGPGVEVPPATSALDLTLLGDLRPFVELSYEHFANVLEGLLDVLEEVQAGFPGLTTPLPAINRSVSDLLSLVGGFERGVANADARFDNAIEAIKPENLGLPALRLQDIGRALRGAFGLPDDIDPYAADTTDWVRFDYDTSDVELLLSFSLYETLSTKLGLDIAPSADPADPHLTSAGVLEVTGTLNTWLDVAIPLADPDHPWLLDTTRIDGTLNVQGESQTYISNDDGLGLVFRSSAGPLAVFIQDGDVLIDYAFSLPGMNLGGDGRKALSAVTYGDFKAAVESPNVIDIVLPMFYGGEGPDDFIGEYRASGTIAGATVTMPEDLAAIVAEVDVEGSPFDPFENILLAVDALDLYLETLSDQLSSEILGIQLPFIGDQMADVLFIEDFRSTLVRALKNGIENAVNPTPELVTGILNGLFAPGGALASYAVGVVDANHKNLTGPVDTRYREWRFTLGRTAAGTPTNAGAAVFFVDDFDIGPDHLGFDIKAPVQVTMDWTIEIALGVNFGEGAYLLMSDGDEVNVDLTVKMPSNMAGTAYRGELGYLSLDVTDPGADSQAQMHFVVDVTNGGDVGDAKLGFADLGNIDPMATVAGAGGASFQLLTINKAGLPELQSDLVFDWDLGLTDVYTLDGDAVTDGIQTIALNNMKIDAVAGLKRLLGPAFEEVARYIEPFMPVVDVLTEPIPILSDLAGEPFTLLDLAGIFGDVDPRFIEAVADILDVISAIGELVTEDHVMDLGSLVLYDRDLAITNFNPAVASSSLSGIGVAVDGSLTGMTHDATLFQGQVDAMPLIDLLRSVEALGIPIVTDARQGIKMWLGQTADLVTYALPPLGVEFSYLQTFPIWGPLAVSIEISFGFTVDLHGVGFDTYGYIRYADGGFRNPALIFDGFFLSDGDLVTKQDLPDITFEFGLVGAAELNLGIARAGVGGGIDAKIIFDWHDSIADGNVHISELLGNVIAADGNPLAVFDVSGALTFQMFAFLEISLLGIDERFPITPETTLFSFDETFARDPILGKKGSGSDAGTLYLNMGPNAIDRLNGNTADGNESMELTWLGGGDVSISSSTFGVSGQMYHGVSHIVGLGGEGNDTIILNGFDGSGVTADFDGGVGDDTIKFVSGGASASMPGARIVGGLGNDVLWGSDANDVITGGEGNDEIRGQGGYDILFGDQGRVADTVTVPFISSRITESDGDDTIDGGPGDDVVIGAGGHDRLNGGADDDLILGDGGRFEYTMTPGVNGHVNVGALWPTLYEREDPGTYKDPAIISSEIDAVKDAVLDRIRATELGLGGNDVIKGNGGNDLVFGGTGDDDIEGNGGGDLLLGGKGFDWLRGDAGKDTMFGGDQADVMDGGADDDVMSGDAGNDFMHGNGEADVMKGGTGADIMFGDAGDDQVFGQTEPDVLFGGADNDLVVGGTSNDIMFGDDGLVVKIDPNPLPPDNGKYIGMGSHALAIGAFKDGDIRTLDLIITDVQADDGDDMMSGDAGDDLMLGGGGNDLMAGDVDPRLPSAGTDTSISEDVLIGDGGRITFNQRRYRTIETVIGADTTGEPFDDVIYGDNGNDYLFGGRGSDLIFGGHGTTVTDVTNQALGSFRGATDPGASDNDIVFGDNGRLEFAGPVPKANFGVLERALTTDEAEDTGGHDYIEGELGNDVAFGGVNGAPAGTDRLFGQDGSDVMLGDNGELDWALGLDFNLDTLDLITSYRDGLGGIDIVTGSAGDDVLIGGTAGDTMYGDDVTASHGADDGEDIMLGDNGKLRLIGTAGRLTVLVAAMTQGTAVDLITTIDDVDLGDPNFDELDEVNAVGGADTMSGNAKADIVIGGINGDPAGIDKLYGDRKFPTDATIAQDRDDILVGDNALLDFTYLADTDRNTLDLIRSFEDGLGWNDELSGNRGADVAIGGTADDTIYGDAATAAQLSGANDKADMLIGDNADIFLVATGGAVGGDLKAVLGAAVKTIRSTDEEHPEYGGVDTISGNAGGDIALGGVQGDTIYGDREDVTQTNWLDGNDILLGDNGALEWLSNGRLGEIRGIVVADENDGLAAHFADGPDADADPDFDIDLTTLDLITTEQPTNGGRDLIYGDNGRDTIFGGTDADRLHGDSGDLDTPMSTAGNDLMFGDHGRLYPQFSTQPSVNSRNFFAIHIRALQGGEGDEMWGEEGDDIMLGQQGDDRMWGGSGDDDMIGGHNVAQGWDELDVVGAIAADLAVDADTPYNVAMNDAMDGGSGDDAMAGDNTIMWRRGDNESRRFQFLTQASIYTTAPDTITVNIGGDPQNDPNNAVSRDIRLLDHSDAVQTTPLGRFGNDVMAGGIDHDVMFGQLGDDLMQGDGSIDTEDDGKPEFITRELGFADSGSNPDTDDTLYFNIAKSDDDGDDYMEGNGGRDLMYGGLGQDDMIGGSSALFGLDDENADKLGVIAEQLRPDDSDTMFGGAGVDVGRNALGDATTDSTNTVIVGERGHARDADFMMGDNANVYRIVVGGAYPAGMAYPDGSATTLVGDKFLTFLYDNYPGVLRIVPRAMEQLDYTLGGGDYRGGDYNVEGQAMPTPPEGEPVVADNGKADLIHGEAGDDIIFGMTGSDVLFGEGQDDDLVGGYGHDWISGGTGQDGVLGDDGLFYTSRNSTLGEPLYGIAGLLDSDASTRYSNGDALNETITTPGSIQTATINIGGALKKTADLVPFSYQFGWMALDDEFPDNMNDSPYADDIIFGGWGSDWLHGGSGDDAISGAEALAAAYVPDWATLDDDIEGNEALIDLGYDNVGIASALIVNPTQQNPGNVLAFNAEDLDGQHLNNRFRAGEFRLYDEYNPRAKILLSDAGLAVLDGSGVEFLLNFNAQRDVKPADVVEFEGVWRPAGTVPKATGQQTESYVSVSDDGADAIFGDLGNDWLVGGTGRDNVYGGWGNDLLQVDDNLDTETVPSGPQAGVDVKFDNEAPDTHPTYEDRAYGGAGRDVIIGNTGGDRLIDWVGEHNSYIVPYAPFGQASVSRTLQPYLPEFLYALSAGDGADPTRYADAKNGDPPQPTNNNPIPSRNGEPYGELGLVLQKDFAWGDQTGAPADPQAGNIPGGPRDVLRSADFSGNNASSFVAASGTWKVANGVYEVAPSAATGSTDAVSLFNADVAVPGYFELTATINAVKPIAGFKANAYIVFDYYGPDDFKFAGINVSTNKVEIGQRTSAGWQVLAFKNMLMKAGSDYNVLVAINGSAVTLVVNNALSVSHAFAPRIDADGFSYGISAGMFGLGADNAKARIDNVVLQRIPPKVTLTLTDEFSGAASTLLTPYLAGFATQGGRLVATPAPGAPFAIATNDIAVSTAASLRLEAVLSTAGVGGVVFDLYSPTDFKWAAISKATNQVLVGHYTAKAGWVVDLAVARTIAAGDRTLTVSLKDSTVNVSLDGQLVISRIYNGTVVDGAIGVLASGGATSFDRFTFQTDDARFEAATASTASPAGTATTTSRVVSAFDPAPTGTTSTTTSVAQPIEVGLPVTTAADSSLIDWRATLAPTSTTTSATASASAVPADDWRSAFVTNLGVTYNLSSLNRSLSLLV